MTTSASDNLASNEQNATIEHLTPKEREAKIEEYIRARDDEWEYRTHRLLAKGFTEEEAREEVYSYARSAAYGHLLRSAQI